MGKMSKGLIALTVVGVLAVITLVFGVMFVSGFVGLYNQATSLKNNIEAEQKNVRITYDNSWKVIMQQAEVSNQYSAEYKQIIKSMTADRYAAGTGSMMAQITENNPTIDLSPLKALMNNLEAVRNKYQADQKKVLSMNVQYNDIRTKLPYGPIMSMIFQPIDVKTVTSTRTENAFETGKDDEVSVYSKDKKDTVVVKDTITKTVTTGTVNMIAPVGNVMPTTVKK